MKTKKKGSAYTREYFKVLTLRTIGNFLILSSLFMIVKTFYLPVREEIRYDLDQLKHKKYVSADLPFGKQILKGQLIKQFQGHQVELLVPEDPNFSIVIPKVAANAKIIPNVDPVDQDSYLLALKSGVAHALGTAFPGENSHIFLFAHSTDYFWNVGTYNAVFYLLYKLEKGDEIDLFYKGQRFVYKVIDTRIVDASQVEFLTRKTNHEFLTLQTCWPPGTTLKRLLVFATRVSQ